MMLHLPCRASWLPATQVGLQPALSSSIVRLMLRKPGDRAGAATGAPEHAKYQNLAGTFLMRLLSALVGSLLVPKVKANVPQATCMACSDQVQSCCGHRPDRCR